MTFFCRKIGFKSTPEAHNLPDLWRLENPSSNNLNFLVLYWRPKRFANFWLEAAGADGSETFTLSLSCFLFQSFSGAPSPALFLRHAFSVRSALRHKRALMRHHFIFTRKPGFL
jgi:hypothetical protein